MSNSTLIQLGKTIAKLRKARNWSQESFAAVCGIHRSYIGRIEVGKANLSTVLLEVIAIALSVSISELFAMSESIEENT